MMCRELKRCEPGASEKGPLLSPTDEVPGQVGRGDCIARYTGPRRA